MLFHFVHNSRRGNAFIFRSPKSNPLIWRVFLCPEPAVVRAFLLELQMQTITINVGDDGRITVDVEEDGQPVGEPYECQSLNECLQYVKSVMTEESGEAPGETEQPENYARMWREESKKRGVQAAAPGGY